MKSFAERMREDRRLLILKLLSEQPGLASNSSNLHAALHHLRVVTSRAEVLDDLHWLAAQGTLKLQEYPESPGLYAAELLLRGEEVVAGAETITGISRLSKLRS